MRPIKYKNITIEPSTRPYARGGWIAEARYRDQVTTGAVYANRSSARKSARRIAEGILDSLTSQ